MTGNFLSVLTTPGFAIAGVLFVCVVGCLAMVSLRLRAVSQQLEILSSAFDEEWRRIANLQRSVEEMTEFGVRLGTRGQERFEGKKDDLVTALCLAVWAAGMATMDDAGF